MSAGGYSSTYPAENDPWLDNRLLARQNSAPVSVNSPSVSARDVIVAVQKLTQPVHFQVLCNRRTISRACPVEVHRLSNMKVAQLIYLGQLTYTHHHSGKSLTEEYV